MLLITTETGSTYEFHGEDMSLVTKNGHHTFKYGIVKATPDWHTAVKAIRDEGGNVRVSDWVGKHGEDRFPRVGECLYVAGFDAWYLSTPVVSVEEID